MTDEEVLRLRFLSRKLNGKADQLSALLAMPSTEEVNGDLALIDVGEWNNGIQQAEKNLVFVILEAQGVVEQIIRRQLANTTGTQSEGPQPSFA